MAKFQDRMGDRNRSIENDIDRNRLKPRQKDRQRTEETRVEIETQSFQDKQNGRTPNRNFIDASKKTTLENLDTETVRLNNNNIKHVDYDLEHGQDPGLSERPCLSGGSSLTPTPSPNPGLVFCERPCLSGGFSLNSTRGRPTSVVFDPSHCPGSGSNPTASALGEHPCLSGGSSPTAEGAQNVEHHPEVPPQSLSDALEQLSNNYKFEVKSVTGRCFGHTVDRQVGNQTETLQGNETVKL